MRSDATILSRTEFVVQAGGGDCDCEDDSGGTRVAYAINLSNLNVPGLGDLGLNSVIGYDPARDKNCERKLVKKKRCFQREVNGEIIEVCTPPMLTEAIVCTGPY